jgi:hypothetical protein
MDLNSLCKTIDFAKHDFSVLLVNPKPTLLTWLSDYSKRKGLEKYRLYSPEENLALMIPKIDRFTAPGSFDRFLAAMKPRLLSAELSRFGITPEDFGHPITKETFDEFFETALRDGPMLMTDFKSLVFPT